MKNDRPTALAMTSIENQMITETKDFNKKVIDHSAQIKTRHMDFILSEGIDCNIAVHDVTY